MELDEADDVKVETNPRQSLTNRLSSLYETILSKAAPHKKNERFTGNGNTAADVDAKVSVLCRGRVGRTNASPKKGKE